MMPRQRLYYDYVNGNLIPYWYVLTFKPNQIDWDKPMFYFRMTAPFEYFNRNEFDDSIASISILMSDIVVNKNDSNKIGIRLDRIKQMLQEHGITPEFCRKFIIQVPDIQEILTFVPNKPELHNN